MDALLTGLASGNPSAPQSDADRRLLEYARKLTVAPADVAAEDVDGLRQHGFSERAIHDVCAIAAYFAFVNRIADGLGVELEHSSDDGEP
jgi:uncharacterized peroxidase-related enzyme